MDEGSGDFNQPIIKDDEQLSQKVQLQFDEQNESMCNNRSDFNQPPIINDDEQLAQEEEPQVQLQSEEQNESMCNNQSEQEDKLQKKQCQNEIDRQIFLDQTEKYSLRVEIIDKRVMNINLTCYNAEENKCTSFYKEVNEQEVNMLLACVYEDVEQIFQSCIKTKDYQIQAVGKLVLKYIVQKKQRSYNRTFEIILEKVQQERETELLKLIDYLKKQKKNVEFKHYLKNKMEANDNVKWQFEKKVKTIENKYNKQLEELTRKVQKNSQQKIASITTEKEQLEKRLLQNHREQIELKEESYKKLVEEKQQIFEREKETLKGQYELLQLKYKQLLNYRKKQIKFAEEMFSKLNDMIIDRDDSPDNNFDQLTKIFHSWCTNNNIIINLSSSQRKNEGIQNYFNGKELAIKTFLPPSKIMIDKLSQSIKISCLDQQFLIPLNKLEEQEFYIIELDAEKKKYSIFRETKLLKTGNIKRGYLTQQIKQIIFKLNQVEEPKPSYIGFNPNPFGGMTKKTYINKDIKQFECRLTILE